MVIASEPDSLDPRYAFDAMSLRLTRLLHAGLFRLDSALEPTPSLAQRWSWEGDRTLRVQLRSDALFHSGRRVRPEDVIATVAWMKAPQHGGRSASVFDELEEVAAAGEDAVLFRWKRKRASALADLEFPILRADQTSLGVDRDGWLDGAGPFTARRIDRSTLELEHFPHVSGARLIRIRVVANETARAMRLHAGSADIVANALSPPLLPEPGDRDELKVLSTEGANVTYLLLNHETDAFAEVESRRALWLALDRGPIVHALFGAHASASSTLLPAFHWAYSPPASEPGGPRGAGPRRPITLLTSTDRTRVDACRMIAVQLERAGFTVDVVPLEFGTLLGRLAAGRFDAAMLQIPELGEPSVLRNFLHSSAIPPAGANRARVRDEELDALLDEADLALDRDERRRLLGRIEERVRTQAHLLPLWHEDQVAVVSRNALDFVPSPDGRWLGLVRLR